MAQATYTNGDGRKTSILPVQKDQIKLSGLEDHASLEDWTLDMSQTSQDYQNLSQAANELRDGDLPVAFPTETVYGLGADATRSEAVKGIFKAKNRPSDNPLIVHVYSLNQLRAIVRGSTPSDRSNSTAPGIDVPSIYLPLIQRFWPGPLSLIMPLSPSSSLAPEVTAGLTTFGARMPSNPVALALMKLADTPIAAPSANASGKPSPTTAAHVAHDMAGRISTIVDGGPCAVGVESTVVDGLCDPPLVLRPGGVGLDEIRACPGWEDCTIGYKNVSERNDEQPRAPGMKYKHYSPRATVVLYEAGSAPPGQYDVLKYAKEGMDVGIVRTTTWPEAGGLEVVGRSGSDTITVAATDDTREEYEAQCKEVEVVGASDTFKVWEVSLGAKPERVAHGLFAALRELDLRNVGVIFVEGISETGGDVAAAVMNRLRKAAEIHV